MLEFKLVNALEKVLPNQQPASAEQLSLQAVKAETCSFQLAFKATDLNDLATLRLESAAATFATYKVGLVPAQNPAPADADDAYLVTEPTLLPDLLQPLAISEGVAELTLKSSHRGWNSIWIDVTAPAGTHQLKLTVTGPYQQGRTRFCTETPQLPTIFEAEVSLEVVDFELPKPKIVNTQWFHTDSLANYYDLEVWSEKHWEVIENHFASAVRMGVNCLLMPLWTPPLDTAVGTYRRTVQLLDIHQVGETYRFDFTRAKRWVELMRRHGITAVEVPHLFTQWGAEATPRFLITHADGSNSYQFGWDEAATSPAYRHFLEQLIPAVRDFLTTEISEANAWYHISDEPTVEQLSAYQQAKAQVVDLLAGAQIIDALSEPELVAAVEIPVVATNAVEHFRALDIEPSWVYNCVAQDKEVANRFIAQTGTRHREIGFQLYKSGATGVLHWAFNFYNAQYSLGNIDPYQDTAAGGGFISGDAFVVYPAKNGEVLESLRHRILRTAMNDLALCQAAEKIVGKAAVLAAIDPHGTLDYNRGFESIAQIENARKALLKLLSAN
ncbi:MAG: DUF4091 domain-containing protein [Actinomycetaceae bacterium]|nr:DUF4091 domain-containing protein [Actinomycetaceae bacterium]